MQKAYYLSTPDLARLGPLKTFISLRVCDKMRVSSVSERETDREGRFTCC